ncbi:H-NS family nucleoid-associated regulatory protein [Paraburkholderia sp. BCC1876]|uniref:H-NS family nucleoid-associated regulatory protein n=1 Tax=Paraburkholderia sp. BCC1876 TaxID=2676303 RepID=UPI001591C68F|nr:H-NS family nucleoid-associated regulatory protein [Paraburkholderia sp. BCC1876]
MATLEQIQEKMKKLQAQAEALISKKAQAAVDQIRKLMLEYDLTTEDIEAKAKEKRAAKALKVSPAAGKTKATTDAKGKTAPKYMHPQTGATWTGHGRAPAWIANVRDRAKFLIAGSDETTVAVTAGAVSKAKTLVKKASKAVGAKGQPKGPQPALYRDRKTGATWSGRGRAPAWLAGAKDRSKFLIDGASATTDVRASTETKPSAKKAVSKKAGVKKVAATKTAPTKKVAVKKAVAKKAVSAKVPAKKALAKKAPRQSVAVPAPAAAVESGAELTT